MKFKILFFLIIFSVTSSLSAMNATQLYWQTKKTVELEKIKDRLFTLPHQLIEAVQKNNDYEVARLLQSGVNPNIRNALGMPLLDFAVYHGYTRIADLLISKGALVNGDAQYIPLITAVKGNQLGMVKLLLSAKAAPNKQDKNGQTALMFAVEYNHPEIIRLLLQGGADAHLENKFHTTAIDMARQKNNQKLVDLLHSVSFEKFKGTNEE